MKAALKKVAFQRKLSNGFQHLVFFFLQAVLLSASLFSLLVAFKYVAGISDEILFPVSKHVGAVECAEATSSRLWPPWSTSKTTFALKSGVYVVRGMISSPFQTVYHVHDKMSW